MACCQSSHLTRSSVCPTGCGTGTREAGDKSNAVLSIELTAFNIHLRNDLSWSVKL
jgi:hypothetical protein